MGWVKVTPETMPPDREPVIVTALHNKLVDGILKNEKSVFTDVRWNYNLQAWEIKEWNICEFEWTTYHSLEVTHWMPVPKPAVEE